jgi:methylation protein EvaC
MKQEGTPLKPCLICNNPIEPFMSFGKMPIANGFLTPDQYADEYFFELKTAFCPQCKMVQLTELVDERKMFHENYAFFSSTSVRMAEHFQRFAAGVMKDYLEPTDPFVVEIGSNDGIMLQNFARADIRHLGIEPSANVAEVARGKGISSISEFFNEDLARRIVAEHGQADAFLGANVMCHIPYLHSVAAGIRILLKPRGVLMFEDPYLGDIVQKTSFDQIYDEHAFYFSVASVSHLFGEHGLEVIDVLPQEVHGGSMRYVIAHKGARPVTAAVAAQRAKEDALGLHRPETYDGLRRNIERSRDDLMVLLRDLKRQGKRVVGYGATSKSTTVTNYCGITPDLVEFITDTTPIKQGKFSPGAHIPVRPYNAFQEHYPDYALLFAWNHAGEIMSKEQKFRAVGGKWINYVPTVQVSE